MADSSTATHLSIGEVLGLLLEEFPDITISKIRFLESQGLIEPERTPSGYRKFFDEDVELLRLILREQREKFLPLRVIKDRLHSGEIEPDPTPARGAATDIDMSGTDGSGHLADGGAPVPLDGPTNATVAKHPAGAQHPPSAPADPNEPDVGPAVVPPATAADSDPDPDPVVAPTPPTPPPTAPPTAPPTGPTTRGAQAGTPNAHLLPGVLLSRDELCAMASITDDQLDQLEEYGVVTGPDGVTDLYGDDSVEVAAAAGGFLRAGLDARHLRGWRHSVEREAGLYEQLILPVLRQRNPQARVNATTHLQELDVLGGRLRSAMMRAALRRYLET